MNTNLLRMLAQLMHEDPSNSYGYKYCYELHLAAIEIDSLRHLLNLAMAELPEDSHARRIAQQAGFIN